MPGTTTASPLTLAALTLADGTQKTPDTDAVILVVPSDHVIRGVSAFQPVIETVL